MPSLPVIPAASDAKATAAIDTPVPTTEELFADAFAEAVEEDAPAKAPDTGADAAASAAAKVVEAPKAADTSGAGEKEADGTAALDSTGDAPADKVTAPPAEAAVEETPETKIARLEADNAALRAPKKAPEAAPKASPAADAAEAAPAKTAADTADKVPEPQWFQPNEQEAALIKKFEDEWPDIAQANAVMLKQVSHNIVQWVFSEMAKVYNPTLKQFAEMSKVMQEQMTLSALRNEHSDYDEVYDNVVAWVDTLPAAFKAGAKQVMESGTPEEVVGLIDEYKKAHPAAAAASAAHVAAPAKTELSAAAKQAARKLQVVGSKRTTPISAPDANDFEGAWAEAVQA